MHTIQNEEKCKSQLHNQQRIHSYTPFFIERQQTAVLKHQKVSFLKNQVERFILLSFRASLAPFCISIAYQYKSYRKTHNRCFKIPPQQSVHEYLTFRLLVILANVILRSYFTCTEINQQEERSVMRRVHRFWKVQSQHACVCSAVRWNSRIHAWPCERIRFEASCFFQHFLV